VAVAGDVGGELAAFGAFGFELGFSSFGSGAFGVGEGSLCFELCVVAFAEGFALAGGVVADSPGFLAGVGLGLAGAGGLGVSGGAGVTGCCERVVALALEAGGVAAGGGLPAGFLFGGRDLGGGIAVEPGELCGEAVGGLGPGGRRRGRRPGRRGLPGGPRRVPGPRLRLRPGGPGR
jgi:hypothetical protein